MKIQHILVIMDPTINEQPALIKAIEMAKRFDASIELFLVVYHSGLAPKWFNKEHPQEIIISNYLKTKQRWLDTYLSQVSSENISVSSEVRWHKPLYAEILKKITQCHADMVVKSTHQHPVFDRLLFTPNDWQLLKTCPVPLLLAKSSTTTAYKNVLAAVDLEKSDDERRDLDDIILDTTAMMSEYFNAVAHVIHAYDPMGHELWPGDHASMLGVEIPSYDYQGYHVQQKELHEKEFTQLVEHYAFEEKNIHFVAGIATNILVDGVNDEAIDLLIMGVRFHSGFVSSTAETILDEVDCDILAIKSSY
jgi:universal stress protein E